MKNAVDFKSLDDLTLSTRTRNYIKKVGLDSEGIVLTGRITDLLVKRQEARGESLDSLPKWRLELRDALNEAGFIRSDIDFRSLGIGSMYVCMYASMHDPKKFDISDIATLDVKYTSTEQYEGFTPVTQEAFERICEIMEYSLGENRRDLIAASFAFDGVPLTFEEVAKRHGMTLTALLSILRNALNRLSREELPPLLNARRQNLKIDSVIAELDQLTEAQKSLDEKKSALYAKLKELAKTPATNAEKAKERIARRPMAETKIDVLNLTTRSYNCLRRAQIDTVADVLDLPRENWPRVRNLGKKGLVEIEEAMQRIGFVDFLIS